MYFKDQNKRKAITFSYDDGVSQDIRLIELLNRYNLKCTFNLNSQLLGKNNILIRENQRIAHYKIHPDDVQYVYEGHEIAVHTLTHPDLRELDEKGIIHEVEDDRLRLSELAGYEVVGMAYPYGTISPDGREARIIEANTGVKYARTVELTDSFDRQIDLHQFAPNAYHMNFDRMMELGRKFVELETDKPQIFYIWGHAYEMDFRPDCWIKLEEFFKLISNRDDIFYGTNAEVLL